MVYFRAVAKNPTGTDNGTVSSFLTVFSAPVSFTAKALGATIIGLNWEKTGDQTYILYKTTGYPIDRLDGTQVYFGSANSFTHASLTAGLTYFYQAWSWQSGDVWSTSDSEDAATTQAVLSVQEQTNQPINQSAPSGIFNPPVALKVSKLPFYPLLKTTADDLGQPEGIGWMWLTIWGAVIIGALAWILTRNNNAALIGVGLVLLGGWWVQTIPGIIPILFILINVVVHTIKGQQQQGEL